MGFSSTSNYCIIILTLTKLLALPSPFPPLLMGFISLPLRGFLTIVAGEKWDGFFIFFGNNSFFLLLYVE